MAVGVPPAAAGASDPCCAIWVRLPEPSENSPVVFWLMPVETCPANESSAEKAVWPALLIVAGPNEANVSPG